MHGHQDADTHRREDDGAPPVDLAQCAQAVLARSLRLACMDLSGEEELPRVVRRYIERAADELLMEALAEHPAG